MNHPVVTCPDCVGCRCRDTAPATDPMPESTDNSENEAVDGPQPEQPTPWNDDTEPVL